MDGTRQDAEQTARLIEQLTDPACYDHPTGDMQVLETQISQAILTGSYVYTLKKPVDPGFFEFYEPGAAPGV